ncbi:Uma2 family endonuclease [Nonomuraea jiangxiensis]|uniref:Endonuclease, Uma2 family (Restriction endonuclease fold) n=1 Tax=Nonomuraea jiangxiensis TaxID=633440 RepID=A0A1G9U6N9_9ACTN|nr:Uma2 family endonuclease [Nonomuraea jiangxiensis]SDM55225.1 Endonuclease, Uma2 family (restriction endonuclease fold) [Nonomuraea jiangxiensis]
MVAMLEEEHRTESTRVSNSERPLTARELFDVLPPLPGFRVEVIEGNLIVSPSGSPEHHSLPLKLHVALQPMLRELGLCSGAGGPNICIEGPRDSLVPDYVVYKSDCGRWGNELLSPGVLLAAEVVSPSSVRIDNEDKVRLYALGQVPIYLLIDPVSNTPGVTVFSDIKDDTYRTIVKVDMGTPVKLPPPVDFELDTSIFKV